MRGPKSCLALGPVVSGHLSGVLVPSSNVTLSEEYAANPSEH